MILLKLNLINNKISDFLNIKINALAWIVFCAITLFMISGTYLNHGDELIEKYNNHFVTKQIEPTQILVEKTVETDTQTDKNKFNGLIIWFVYMWMAVLVVGGVFVGR